METTEIELQTVEIDWFSPEIEWNDETWAAYIEEIENCQSC